MRHIFKLSKRLIKQKPELVQKIREVGDTLSLHRRNVNTSKIVGSSVGIVSGGCVIAGIALAPVTFGISAIVLTTVGGIGGVAGGATFVGADIVENQLVKEELEKIQSELSDFHNKLQVLAKFDSHGLLADKVKRFGGTLLELGDLSETGFINFLEKTLEAVTRYFEDLPYISFKELVENVLKIADEAKMRDFMKKYILPHLNKAKRDDLEQLISILKLLIDSAKKIYSYIKLMVHFIIPLNKEVLPIEAITRGVVGGTLDCVKLASEAGQAFTKIAPQVLKGLGYAAGGVAIALDLGFLIHTCVTIGDVPHVEKLRSMADQIEEMDLESVLNFTLDHLSKSLIIF